MVITGMIVMSSFRTACRSSFNSCSRDGSIVFSCVEDVRDKLRSAIHQKLYSRWLKSTRRRNEFWVLLRDRFRSSGCIFNEFS